MLSAAGPAELGRHLPATREPRQLVGSAPVLRALAPWGGAGVHTSMVPESQR